MLKENLVSFTRKQDLMLKTNFDFMAGDKNMYKHVPF